jgi:hypothetical protein
MTRVFNGLNPYHCFELWVQVASLNYVQLMRQPDDTVLDYARPAWAQPVNASVVYLAEQLAAIPVLDYLPDRPASVNWDAWDWQAMRTKPGGYTEVNLVVRARTYHPETKVARVWWVAGSIIPDEPDKEIFYRADRLDHFNWMTAPADDVLAFIERIQTL